jgi:hypothetical protein
MKIKTPISAGELVDKLTILEIKKQKISDKEKLQDVNKEYDLLKGIFIKKVVASDSAIGHGAKLLALKADLYEVNLGLWHIEDNIRQKEREQDFGPVFIRLARDVYYTNDQRFELKSEINNLLGSELKEQKSYESYS